MSATDELRRMLDERRVEYEARTSPMGGVWTYWDAFNGHRVYAMDNENGTVKIFGEWDVTPEQAIAVTLGRRTCRLISAPQYGDDCKECSACGAVFDEYMFKSGRCPSCGAKVVDE